MDGRVQNFLKLDVTAPSLVLRMRARLRYRGQHIWRIYCGPLVN